MMKLNTDMPGFFCVYVFAFFSRWAQFFIHPLMIRDAIDREVEAVDSGKRCTLCLTIVFFHHWNSYPTHLSFIIIRLFYLWILKGKIEVNVMFIPKVIKYLIQHRFQINLKNEGFLFIHPSMFLKFQNSNYLL